MHSKKLSRHLFAVAALALAASAHAELQGTAEAGTAHQRVSGVGINNVHSGSVLLDVKEGYKLGVGVSALHAWGDEAHVLNVRAVNKVGQSFIIDTNVAASDRGDLAPRYAVDSLAKLRVSDALQVGAGVGYSKYRAGDDAWTFKAQADYALKPCPVVLSADVIYSHDLYGTGDQHRIGVGATYGQAGKWTAAVRFENGPALFDQQLLQPAIDNTQRLGVDGRYWVGKDWGLSAGVSRLKDGAYKSNELRAGVFWKL